jgi:cytochrome c
MRSSRSWLGLPIAAASVLLAGAATAQDDAGQLMFNNACRTCHVVKEGDNRLGPNLYKIVGRLAGSVDGYGYSSALDNADFVWDEETLDRFIANPEQAVPGNNMKPFGGIASREDRAKIIGFLRAQGGDWRRRPAEMSRRWSALTAHFIPAVPVAVHRMP